MFALIAGGCQSSEQIAADHRDRANAFIEEGDYERARLEAANLLKLDPRNVDDLVLAARIQRALGNLRRAYSFLSVAHDDDQAHAGARVELAQWHALARQPHKVIELLAPVLDQPDNAAADVETVGRAFALRAAARFSLSDDDDARADLHEALQRDPDSDVAVPLQCALLLRERGAAAATARLEQVLQKRPHRTDLLALLMRIHLDHGDPKAAADVLGRMLASDPARHELRAHRAALLQRAGAGEQGETLLREGIEEHASASTLKLALVRHLLTQGRQDTALATLNSFIDTEPQAFDLRIARAAVLGGLGMHEEARSAYRDIINDRPPLNWLTEATVGLAQFERSSNRVSEAMRTLDGFLKTHSNSANALALRARLRLEAGDLDGAVDDLEAALSADRDNTQLRFDLARLHVARRDWVLAQVQLRQVIEQAPALVDAREALIKLHLEQGAIIEARQHLANLLEVAPGSADALALAFDVERRSGDWEAAARFATRMREQFPDRSMGAFLLAVALLGRDDAQGAERELRTALALDPMAHEPLSALVRLMLDQERGNDAAQLLDDTLSLSPDHPVALSWRGQLHLRAREPVKASERFERALQARPDLVDAWRGLAASFLAREDTESARDALERGVAALPVAQQEQLSVDLTLLHLKRNDVQAAVAEAERYLRANPESIITVNNLAMMLVDHAPYDNSLARARVLVGELVPSSDEKYVDTYALVMTRAGNPDAAIEAIDAYRRQWPTSALLSYRRGIALAARGDQDLASQEWRLALRRNPDASFAEDARARLGERP